MPERSGAQLYGSLERRINGLRRARLVGDRALREGTLSPREVGLLYEVTFLNLAITFEAFQEGLFYSSLLRSAAITGVEPLIPFRTRSEAERLVLATERSPFLSWTRPRDNIERARRFLQGGRPFSRLDRRDRDNSLLQSLFVVRNAIAHQSGPARREFEALPLSGLPPGKRRPGEYLRQVVGTVTQHEVFCREVLRIGKALSASSESSARRHLLAERNYRAGDEVSRGRYRCCACGTVGTVTSVRSVLSNCTACPTLQCLVCGRAGKSTFEKL